MGLMLTEWMPCGRHAHRVLPSRPGVESAIQESVEEIKTTGLKLIFEKGKTSACFRVPKNAVVV
jgi:hypothetical protein